MADQKTDNEALIEKFQKGNIIKFGRYRQGKDGSILPLEWIVLERKGNAAKLLSLKGVECLPYNNDKGNTNWKECSLRSWLNSDFYNSAFDEAESDSILLTDIIAEKHPKNSTNPGRDTKDKVFILNYQEANALGEERTMYLTPWAASNDNYFKLWNSWYGKDFDGYAFWWLRTPGSLGTTTTIMGGSVTSRKDAITSSGVAVRPAVWIDLNSEFWGGDFEVIVRNADPEVTVQELISLLKEKYATEKKPANIDTFEAENAKYRTQIKDLKSICVKEYGMTYGAFLKYCGFLEDKTEKEKSFDPSEMLDALQKKYADTLEKPRTLDELIDQNPEYTDNINDLAKYSIRLFGDTAKNYLRSLGIIYTAKDGIALRKKAAEEKAAERASLRAEQNSRIVNQIEIKDKAIANRVYKLFEKLEQLFPEHKVFALDSIDETSRENLSNLSKMIGYDSADDMLLAYGYQKIAGAEVQDLRPTVIYAPGNEPEIVKGKIDSIIRRLIEYYPNKVIERSIQADHSNLASDVSGMYQWLGYKSIGEFLTAYGYTYNAATGGSGKSGRPTTTDEKEIIETLKQRSAGNPYPGVKELREANPDLGGKIKTILNRSKELFGMTFGAYLKEIGVVGSRPKAEPKPKPVQIKEPKVKQSSTVSSKAIKVLDSKLGNKLQDALDKLEGLNVKLLTATNEISVAGSLREDEIVEIPDGIDFVAEKAFIGHKEIKKVKLGKTVNRIERKAFEECLSLEEVVIENPECFIAADAFGGCPKLKIKIDRSNLIAKYKDQISSNYKNEICAAVDTIEKCFETAGGRPEMFWAGEDWRFAFSIGDKVYQTTIKPISEDYTEIDDILENLFGFERVTGTLDYFINPRTKSNVISETIYLDENGNII